MANTLVGVYDNYQDAQAALNELLNSGFEIENVRLSPEEESATARQSALRHDETDQTSRRGVRGFFSSLFGSRTDVHRHTDMYSEAVRRGSYLLTIHAVSEDQAERASVIMNRHNPVDIDERATAWQSQGWTSHDRTASAYTDAEVVQERSRYASSAPLQSATSAAQNTVGQQTAIPVIQEEMQVGKREVQRGGVRVYQHVTETPVQETLNLREEHVSVERRPVNQPATEADLARMREGSFEMRETAEEPVVAKTVRVVEEVIVGKQVTEHSETVSGTVRRSDVDVERISAVGDDSEFRTHWTNKFGSSGARYEDYAPAYQYGASMAADERYRNHRFSDVEPDIERDWTASHSGSPWKKMKDAVRYGWERVSR